MTQSSCCFWKANRNSRHRFHTLAQNVLHGLLYTYLHLLSWADDVSGESWQLVITGIHGGQSATFEWSSYGYHHTQCHVRFGFAGNLQDCSFKVFIVQFSLQAYWYMQSLHSLWTLCWLFGPKVSGSLENFGFLLNFGLARRVNATKETEWAEYCWQLKRLTLRNSLALLWPKQVYPLMCQTHFYGLLNECTWLFNIYHYQFILFPVHIFILLFCIREVVADGICL
jgi:hypothetical protein